MNSNNYKKCSTCKVIKHLNAFHKGSNECKPCKYQRYIKNKKLYFPKMNCSCGRIVFKHAHNVHLDTNIHKRLTEALVGSNLRILEVN